MQGANNTTAVNMGEGGDKWKAEEIKGLINSAKDSNFSECAEKPLEGFEQSVVWPDVHSKRITETVLVYSL